MPESPIDPGLAMAAAGMFGGSEVDEEEEDDVPMEDGPLRKRSRFVDDAAAEDGEEEMEEEEEAGESDWSEPIAPGAMWPHELEDALEDEQATMAAIGRELYDRAESGAAGPSQAAAGEDPNDPIEDSDDEDARYGLRYTPDKCTECGELKNPAEQLCHSCRIYGHKCTGLL